MTRNTRPRGSKATPFTSTLLALLDDVQGGTESLYEEMTEWTENMEAASMEHLPKYEEVDEARSLLEYCHEQSQTAYETVVLDDFPTDLRDLPVEYTQDTRRSAGSRPGRWANVVCMAEAALGAVEGWLEAKPSTEQGVSEETVELVEEVRTVLEDLIGEAGGVSFPSAF